MISYVIFIIVIDYYNYIQCSPAIPNKQKGVKTPSNSKVYSCKWSTDLNLFYSSGNSQVFLSLQVLCRNADAVGGSIAGLLATWLYSFDPAAPFLFGAALSCNWAKHMAKVLNSWAWNVTLKKFLVKKHLHINKSSKSFDPGTVQVSFLQPTRLGLSAFFRLKNGCCKPSAAGFSAVWVLGKTLRLQRRSGVLALAWKEQLGRMELI